MKVIPTALPGVFLLEPKVFEDSRGFFMETWHEQRLAEAGLAARFVQDNLSRSQRGSLRGLHFQHPTPQVKLCRVTAGEVFDVCVDVRRGSLTFGKAVWTTLSSENKLAMWIPAGFAHGFCVTSESADFQYKCSEYYAPASERGILWNDPALAIPWPIKDPILSAKDQTLPALAESKHLPSYG